MDTRGAIARLTHVLLLKWAGRYHHWDSYPSGLGAPLWELYHGHFRRDLDQMLKVLIDDHPAGWSPLHASDFMQERSLSAGAEASADAEIYQPQCYCHSACREEGWLVTEENASGSGCEWAYVFTSAAATASTEGSERHDMMLVLSSYTPHGKMIGMFGQGNPKVRWPVVAVVDLGGAEPDWERIEAAPPPDPMFPLVDAAHSIDAAHRNPKQGSLSVRRDWGRRGTYLVSGSCETPHYVLIHTNRDGMEVDGTQQVFCTCSPQEEAELPDCPHARAVLHHLQAQRLKATARQERGLEYSGCASRPVKAARLEKIAPKSQ